MPLPTRQTRKRVPPIGEGRSKCIYVQPTVKDTAVLLAFYNPARFTRILRNMLYIIKCLKEAGIPYFIAECVFKGRKPQIPGADLVLHSDSYMFYKEQLLNKLEEKVPEQFTKLVCLDGDILFDAPDWLDQVSLLLDKVHIAQPFSEACWLTPDNTRIRTKKPSYAFAVVHNKLIKPNAIHAYHPGFAWAFRRDTFRSIGGFYNRAIIGNGDMLFVFNFFKDKIPEFWKRDVLKTEFILDQWDAYHARFKSVNPSVGFLKIKALHLFHGVRHNRQYTTRYKDAGEYLQGAWDDVITVNEDGLFEFKDPAASEAVLGYFKRRNEDIPLQEAIKVLSQTRRKAPKFATANNVNLNMASPDVQNLPHA